MGVSVLEARRSGNRRDSELDPNAIQRREHACPLWHAVEAKAGAERAAS